MSVAVVVAVSVNTEGQREVLGLKAGCTCQQGNRDEPKCLEDSVAQSPRRQGMDVGERPAA